MAKTLDPTALIPAGFILEEIISEAERWVLRVRSAARVSNCSCCSQPSTRIHSHYQRRLSDLPSSGRLIQLEIMVRKFRCAVSDCKRRVFAERFTVGSIKSFSRRTERLDLIVHHLGLALGGRPGASFARRLMLPVSNDTLLRVVRRRALPRSEPLTAVGIDDWAFRRNHRYGTIVCDLERRHIVTSCRTGNAPQSRRGWQITLASRLCRVIEVPDMARPLPRLCLTQSTWLTAGI